MVKGFELLRTRFDVLAEELRTDGVSHDLCQDRSKMLSLLARKVFSLRAQISAECWVLGGDLQNIMPPIVSLVSK